MLLKRSLVPIVVVVLSAGAPAYAVEPAPVGPAVSDPSGDCAAPCADLTAASAGILSDGTVIFDFASVHPWLDFAHPPFAPHPQVWIWTTSPDTGPPDATVTRASARIAGGRSFIVNESIPGRPDEIGSTTSLRYVIGEGSEDIPSFLTKLGVPFRWRVALPADETRQWDPQRPVDPTPADSAPDVDSVEFRLPDGDGDGLPDTADPCPAQAFTEMPSGWRQDSHKSGCPAPAVPFAASRFAAAVQTSNRVLKRLWRNRERRAQALRTLRIDLPIHLPAGLGRVQAGVSMAHPDAPRPPSMAGERTCTDGRCVIHMKLNLKGVKFYARKALALGVTFSIGKGTRQISTSARAPLRMPLR
jgi:hypothetical protein